MKLIVGLGNPSKQYTHTRHNVGWDAVAALAENLQVTFQSKPEFKAEIVEARLDKEKIFLMHPLTFMNESGRAVLALKQFYKLDVSDICIVHDDMDFAVSEMAFAKKAGDAGHHGVASVQEALGTTDISRLRIGIGRPTPPLVKEDFVLQMFSTSERVLIEKTIHNAVSAMRDWIQGGLDKAMNTWNGVKGGLDS